MKRSIKAFTKVISYVVGVMIILFALVIVALRMIMPELDKHHGDIEAWASQVLDASVTIKQVKVAWFQYQPVITFDDVTAYNKQTQQPILQVHKIRVFFSLFDSIKQKKVVVSQIMVSGTDVNVVVSSNGEYRLQGLPSLSGLGDSPYPNETKFEDVVAWLSQQTTAVILNDVDIRYYPAKGVNRFVTLYNLRFENNGDKHLIVGKALLHQKLATEVTVVGEWTGDGSDTSKLKAKAYFYVAGLSLSQWLKDQSYAGWHIQDGMANAKVWVTLENAMPVRIQTQFEAYDLKLYSDQDKSTHAIARVGADLAWKQEGNRQVFAGDDIFIDLPKHLWPASSFYVALSNDASGKLTPETINIGYLDLADLQTFMHASKPILTKAQQSILSSLQVTGDIEALSLVFPANAQALSDIEIKTRFRNVSFKPWENYPGIKRLSGMLAWHKNMGNITLNSTQLSVNYESLFDEPLLVEQLSGNVSVNQKPNHQWELKLTSIHAENTDLLMQAQGLITLSAVPSTDIQSTFTLKKANHVTRYLPMRIFSKGLQAWLNQAFLGGEVQQGTAVLRGPLKDFPFDDKAGLFQIRGKANQVEFRFAENWPMLDKINGTVDFTGSKITIDVDNAESIGIPINHVHGLIPSISDNKPSVLTVSADQIQTDFSNALRYLHESPLEKTVGSMFANAAGHGDITLILGLTIPLGDTDATKVLGDLTLSNAVLSLDAWNLQLNKLNGEVTFTESTTRANNITGELFGKPLLFSLQTIKQPKQAGIVRAIATTHLSVADVEAWLKVDSSLVAGAADVSVTLDFANHQPPSIMLQSNLVGVTIDSGDAYAKNADVPKDFNALITIEDNHPLKLQMLYAKQVGAGLLVNTYNGKFDLSGVNISLGDKMPSVPPGPGLYISGYLPSLNWEMIQQYKERAAKSNVPSLPLRGIDVTVGEIDLGGQKITKAQLELTPKNHDWLISITSSMVTGEIDLPQTLSPNSIINAEFDQISLVTGSSEKSSLSVDPKSLPIIHFMADSVTYNGIPLGQVSFKTKPSGHGLSIESLTVRSRHLNFQSSGRWDVTRQGHLTNLQGVAASSDVSKLLEGFGYDVSNFIASKGQLDFNLKWDNAPYDLSLATMDGHVHMNLAKGRIVEIGDTGGAKMDLGKMLSLFSLQTIPRRLSLDFSDLFQKGYSFDYFRGNFSFENGDAFTKDMVIEGPVAKVNITGRIGLVAKDFDLTMDVTPQVTSSIPVAATLLTGQPVVGIAALAVSSVLGSQVNKATSYFYSVKGPWSKPDWQTLTP